MTSKRLAAITFAATITFPSCDFLFGKDKNNADPLLSQASWKTDSIIPAADSNAVDFHFIAAQLDEDSTQRIPCYFTFGKDSLLTTTTPADTVMHIYYAKQDEQQIFIKEDDAFTAYHYVITDSSLQLIAADSALLVLSKN